MITKQLISKSLEDAIVKCGQRLRLTNANIKKVMDDFRKETCNPDKPRKTEKGLFISDDGEIVLTKSGTKKSVNWTLDEILNAYNSYGELHIEHNHPLYSIMKAPVYLSEDDIFRLSDSKLYFESEGVYSDDEWVFKSITCEGANGTRMTLVRGDNFSIKDSNELMYMAMRFQNEVNEYYNENFKKVFDRYDELEKEYNKAHQGEIVGTYEIRQLLLQQAEDEMLNEFNPYPLFQKYKKEFRSINLSLTWSKNL